MGENPLLQPAVDDYHSLSASPTPDHILCSKKGELLCWSRAVASRWFSSDVSFCARLLLVSLHRGESANRCLQTEKNVANDDKQSFPPPLKECWRLSLNFLSSFFVR